jgi:hypothetical protein
LWLSCTIESFLSIPLDSSRVLRCWASSKSIVQNKGLVMRYGHLNKLCDRWLLSGMQV